jgi:hypothetical protein
MKDRHWIRTLWILGIFSAITYYFYAQETANNPQAPPSIFDTAGFWSDLLAIVIAEIIFVIILEPYLGGQDNGD